MMESLRLDLVQMRCEKGAIAENLERMAGYLCEAVARHVDIIGFPEASITGYVNPFQYPEAVLRLDGLEVAQVLEMTRGHPTTLLAGFVEANPQGKPFVTQIAVCNGQLLGFYRKMMNVDEDAEWFSSGKAVPVFKHGDLTFGVAICADISNREVFAKSARQGAHIVFELAAPGLYGEQATRNWQSGFEWWEGECQTYLSQYALDYGIWIAVATQAGRTADEDFPGGGYVFAPDRRRLYATADWSPGAVYVEIEFETRRVQLLA